MPQSASGAMQKQRMEALNFWLPLIGVGVFGAISISAWFADQKIVAVWFGFVCGVILMLLVALQMDQSIRENKRKEILAPEEAAVRVLAAAERQSQRAWLSVRPQLVGAVKPGKPINLELVIENVGKEPAIAVSSHGATSIFDTPKQIAYAPDLWSADFDRVIRMGAELATPMHGRATIFPNNKVMVASQWDHLDTVEQLLTGQKILVIYGAIGYITLGEPRYTWYCFFLKRNERGDWLLGSAPIGNDAS